MQMQKASQIDVLLVEDSPSDAELTRRALQKNNLANTLSWVRDGAEALDFIYCRGRYAERGGNERMIILLDLKLPKLDGLQVLERLKGDPATRSIPIVVLTSSAEDRDLEEAYRLGANSYLVKPVEFGAFVEVVSSAGFYWLIENRQP